MTRQRPRKTSIDGWVDGRLPVRYESDKHIAITRGEMRALMVTMTERQQFILSKRYPLDGTRRWTLAEVGAEIGITGGGVSVAEQKAIRTLYGRCGYMARQSLHWWAEAINAEVERMKAEGWDCSDIRWLDIAGEIP